MSINPFEGIKKAGSNVFNRTLGRLFGAGLNKGAESPLVTSGQAKWAVRNKQTDWRVKLTIPTGSPIEDIFFKDFGGKRLLEPLVAENGIVFPLTPSVIVQHQAGYNPMTLVHSNHPHYAYSSSESSALTVIGEFPVQNYEDARAWVATLHFLRSVTKMFFGGEENDLKGNPPPILHLNGYGEHVFKNVPVVVTNFSTELTQGVDYICTEQNISKDIARSSTIYDFDGLDENRNGSAVSNSDYVSDTWAPTSSIFTVQIQPVYSRDSVKKFSMRDFVNGNLNNKDGIGFI